MKAGKVLSGRRGVNRVQREFYALTRILPLRRCNRIEDKCLRRDWVFFRLAEKTFDSPGMLPLLAGRIEGWLRQDQSEFTLTLAGYIRYMQGDYQAAGRFFVRALAIDAGNLDTWFDLAFSLYHQEKSSFALAHSIFFYFDEYVKHFSKHPLSGPALKRFALILEKEGAISGKRKKPC